MRQLVTVLTAVMIVLTSTATQAQTTLMGPFHKIIVSPFIQVTFVQGDRESVTINNIAVDSKKLHMDVESGTLRLYLEGAKDFPHQQHDYDMNGNRQSHPLYPDHAVAVTVVYRKLDVLSLRGEENYICQSPLTEKLFMLRVYGESTVTFAEVHFDKLHATVYGESSVEFKAGSIDDQVYTCYGEGKINTTAISGHEARVIAYGEAEFRMNVSDRIKITAFGEAKVRYMGNPSIIKGLHFGEMDLAKLN